MHDGRQFEPSAPITSENNNEFPSSSPPFGIFFVMGHRTKQETPKVREGNVAKQRGKKEKITRLRRVKEEERRFVREERKRTEEEEPHASDLHTRPAGCAM